MLYLFTWNPNRFHWKEYIDGMLFPLIKTQDIGIRWSSPYRTILPHEKCVILMQGMGHENGIIAYGHTLNEPVLSYGDKKNFYTLVIEWLFDYRNDNYLTTDMLKFTFPEQYWSPQSSGTKLKEKYEDQLWEMLKDT